MELDPFESFLRQMRPAWQRDALCVEHPEVEWFPERGASTSAAKAVCAACLVRGECLDYALDLGEKNGIWGGLSGRERRAARRERILAA